MPSTPRFFVIAFPSPAWLIRFTTLRALCDPTYTARLPAHVTLQGPLPTSHPLRPVPRHPLRVRLRDLTCLPDSTTLVWNLDAPDLAPYWAKPTYPDTFCPHITLYDGPDATTATTLWHTLAPFVQRWHPLIPLTTYALWPQDPSPAFRTAWPVHFPNMATRLAVLTRCLPWLLTVPHATR